MLTTGLVLFPWCQLLPPNNYRNTFHSYYSSFHYILPCPAQRVRKTWNGGEHIMKRQAHITWQAGSQRALLLSMAGRQNGSFQPALLLAEVIWDHWGKAILGSLISEALLLIRNILFCFPEDGYRGRQWSGAESMSRPKNVPSACLLGQSGGHSLPHPPVMGQVLVYAPPGCNTLSKTVSNHLDYLE